MKQTDLFSSLWSKMCRLMLVVCLFGNLSLAAEAQVLSDVRKQLFDYDWKFALGDFPEAKTDAYDDSGWRALDLPHDWSIEGAVKADNPAGNDGGYFPTGTGWYRKTFEVPSDCQGKRIGIYFEGVYMNSEVFVNGKPVGKHPYGYSSFYYDLTPFLQIGKTNTLAVRVDNSQQKNCRWYTGSGIYRHVWLMVTDPVHVAHWGVTVTTPEVSREKASVRVKVMLKNETSAGQRVALVTRLKRKGISGAQEKTTVDVPAGAEVETVQTLSVADPALWSPETPELYEAEICVEANGKVLDCMHETFGIRTVEYSAERGLLLNGQKILLNGGCVHHDNGFLGAASYDRAEERKVELLKAAGFNAVRTSHNVPSEFFLEACDRLGLLVIDESFDGWRDSKTPHDYSTLFDKWWKKDVEAMVLRDRNHPSIFCWSIGNEVIERKKLEVETTAKKLADHVRSIDPTRPVTSALTTWDSDWEIFDPLAAVHDIVGYNYQIHHVESDHKRVPSRVVMQTESYPREAFVNWTHVNDRPYVIGDFVWTALDYLGESGIGRFYYQGESEGEHYHRNQYPWHGAYCGDIDLTGWRKPISHYRDLLYNPGKKLYMAVREPDGYYGKIRETMWSVWPTWESWNWPGHEGKNIEVEIYSRYPKVRLYLNGELVAERPTERGQEFKAVIPVAYAPGTLVVAGVDANGQEVEKQMLRSAQKPAKLRLTADCTELKADGQDLVYITVEVLDKKGTLDPNADNRIRFELQGAGMILATGSADLKDEEPYIQHDRKAWKGRATVVVKAARKAGKITLKATSPGLSGASVSIRVR